METEKNHPPCEVEREREHIVQALRRWAASMADIDPGKAGALGLAADLIHGCVHHEVPYVEEK
jgi:hypothetical protein